jgi:hypothetical protein
MPALTPPVPTLTPPHASVNVMGQLPSSMNPIFSDVYTFTPRPKIMENFQLSFPCTLTLPCWASSTEK